MRKNWVTANCHQFKILVSIFAVCTILKLVVLLHLNMMIGIVVMPVCWLAGCLIVASRSQSAVCVHWGDKQKGRLRWQSTSSSFLRKKSSLTHTQTHSSHIVIHLSSCTVHISPPAPQASPVALLLFPKPSPLGFPLLITRLSQNKMQLMMMRLMMKMLMITLHIIIIIY